MGLGGIGAGFGAIRRGRLLLRILFGAGLRAAALPARLGAALRVLLARIGARAERAGRALLRWAGISAICISPVGIGDSLTGLIRRSLAWSSSVNFIFLRKIFTSEKVLENNKMRLDSRSSLRLMAEFYEN